MIPSDESRIFLWGGAAVGGSGLLWIFPGINAVCSVVAIAALVVIVSRLGYARAFWVALGGLIVMMGTATLIRGGLFGVVSAAVFAVTIVAPGIAMGAASRGLSTAVKTLWFGFIPILVLLALSASAYVTLLRNMPAVISEVNSSINMTFDQHPAFTKLLMQQMGGSPTKEQILSLFDNFLTMLIRLMPGAVVVGFMAIITIGLALAGYVGFRLKLMIPRLRPFYLWHASEWWLLPTAIGLGLAVLGRNDLWRFAGGNILVVTGNVYALTGLALVESYFKRLSIPVPLRVAFYFIIFIMSFTFVSLIFLAVLGLIDSRFTFRRENPDKEDLEET
jgi:uncharacterized protein YybS (DUF2232 family)